MGDWVGNLIEENTPNTRSQCSHLFGKWIFGFSFLKNFIPLNPSPISHLKKLSDAVMHMRRPNYRTCGVKMRMEIESIEEGFFLFLITSIIHRNRCNGWQIAVFEIGKLFGNKNLRGWQNKEMLSTSCGEINPRSIKKYLVKETMIIYFKQEMICSTSCVILVPVWWI